MTVTELEQELAVLNNLRETFRLEIISLCEKVKTSYADMTEEELTNAHIAMLEFSQKNFDLLSVPFLDTEDQMRRRRADFTRKNQPAQTAVPKSTPQPKPHAERPKPVSLEGLSPEILALLKQKLGGV